MLTFIVVLCITAPHVLYALIWTNPGLWRKRYGDRSVEVFATVATALKVVQFSALALWIISKTGRITTLFPAPQGALGLIVSVAILAAGQVLNAAIYNAIGKNGVYYGFKLGKTVPWHNGFPFNVVSHPQYVGSVLTIWGAAGLYWANLPSGSLILFVYWSALYALTGLQEQFL